MKAEVKVKYSVSDNTNKLINIIAAFDDIGEMLVDAIGEKYTNSKEVLDDYYDAAESCRQFLFQLVEKSISENLGKINCNQI